jgi:hypothetical protein
MMPKVQLQCMVTNHQKDGIKKPSRIGTQKLEVETSNMHHAIANQEEHTSIVFPLSILTGKYDLENAEQNASDEMNIGERSPRPKCQPHQSCVTRSVNPLSHQHRRVESLQK